MTFFGPFHINLWHVHHVSYFTYRVFVHLVVLNEGLNIDEHDSLEGLYTFICKQNFMFYPTHVFFLKY